jgi:hypothetical protein
VEFDSVRAHSCNILSEVGRDTRTYHDLDAGGTGRQSFCSSIGIGLAVVEDTSPINRALRGELLVVTVDQEQLKRLHGWTGD